MPVLAQNKSALFDYDILETFEAGLVLTGQEVKSVKNGSLNLKGSYITFHGAAAMLTNAHISKYGPAGPLPGYDPTQSRRLLVKKRELNYLREKSLEQGLTIVPLKVYTNNRLVKVEIAVAKGRRKFDKREALKKREIEREIRRSK